MVSDNRLLFIWLIEQSVGRLQGAGGMGGVRGGGSGDVGDGGGGWEGNS
jgi:hypothetical protein